MELKFKKLHPDAIPFRRATEGSVGYDMYALEECCIEPGVTTIVKTGIAVEIPQGYNMEVRPRSGMSLKTPLRVVNSPGTIDPDYRGDVGVVLQNTGKTGICHIFKGMKVAQALFVPVVLPELVEVEELKPTKRGKGGYGSTGK